MEWIIREAEQAKKEIPEIEQQLGQKRKDLYDTLKFMKNAEEVESKLSIVQNVSKRFFCLFFAYLKERKSKWSCNSIVSGSQSK